MAIALLFIVNFIMIFALIKLIINKFSKYTTNKFTISKDNFKYIQKVQRRLSYIVIVLNLVFLISTTYSKSSLSIMGITIAIIDITAVIFLGVFSRLKNSLDK